MTVEFNEEKEFSKDYNTQKTQKSGMSLWLIKNGITKTERGSQILLIMVAIICFALAIYFYK